MTFPQRSILWQMVLPVPLAILIVVTASAFLLPDYLAENSRQDAVHSAKQVAQQFKTVRGYYTKNVISKVLANEGLKPSYDHKNMDNGVPLPATFIHDMSALLEKSDTQVKLYSPYPFPNRQDRKLDDYQQSAWAYLQANPKSTFIQSEIRDGREFVRVGIADTMVAQGCVNCHNSRADTPKDDWKLGELRGVLEIATAIDTQLARGEGMSRTIIFAAIIVGTLLTIITVLTAKQITGPIKRMTAAMTDIAAGNTEISIPGMSRKNEVGSMANAVEIFRQDIIEKQKLEKDQIESQTRIDAEQKDMMRQTAENFKESVGSVVEAVSLSSTQLQLSAETMSTTASRATEQSSRAADAAGETSTNVKSVSSSADQLSESISEISLQVGRSSEFAKQAVAAVEGTNGKVSGLADAVDKIGAVVQMITDVAEQTNLLALNATIEAARAGDAGKGFAVVASEVKNLANQTAKATEEISQQIASIQAATGESIESIDGIGAIVAQIDEISATIASSIDEQGTATQEIAKNTEAAANGTLLVSENIGLVTEAAGETGETARQVLDAASELAQQAKNMQSEVDQFVQRIQST